MESSLKWLLAAERVLYNSIESAHHVVTFNRESYSTTNRKMLSPRSEHKKKIIILDAKIALVSKTIISPFVKTV